MEFVIGGVVVVVLLAAVALFNGLVRARTRVQDAWAGVDTELQRRHDLVARLVAAAQGYLDHERDVLVEVTARRNAAVTVDRDPSAGAAAQADVEVELEQDLKRLFALTEGHPELKADDVFLEVQRQLAETEDRINFVRRFYNDRVARYEALRTTLPGVLVARPFGFGPEELFAADADARTAPTIGA